MALTFKQHLHRLSDFSGRETRAEFWPYAGLVFAGTMIGMMSVMIIEMVTSNMIPDLGVMLLGVSAIFILAIGTLAAAIARRLHDRSLSGFWGLLPLPFLFLGLMAMMRIFAFFENGISEILWFRIGLVSNGLYNIALIVLIILLAAPSDKASNKFGPPPGETDPAI